MLVLLGQFEGILRKCYSGQPQDIVKFITDLYSKLSEDIHGYPWSGDSIKIEPRGLTRQDIQMIRCLAKNMGLSD